MLKYIFIVLIAMPCVFAFQSVSGIYDLKVKIGQQTFDDVLVITSNTKGDVTGTFEVPDVFISPFKGKFSKNKMTGSFVAKEATRSFTVNLIGEVLANHCLFNGKLSTGEKVFGLFTGKKRACYE